MPIDLRSGQTILFIGDSITDCGRRERDVPLGVGYVRMFSDLLSIRQPAQRIAVVNRGIGGHTIDDLRSRWADHVLAHRPDLLVMKIGINDVNRWLCNPDTCAKQSPEQFTAIAEHLATLTRRALPATRVLFASPFFASLESDPTAYRHRVLTALPAYVEALRATSGRHGFGFVDLHAAVQGLLAQGLDADAFAEDAVHPTPAGALFIAERIYEALGDG
jgi:acyl-CoA thioesterase-1